MNRKTTKFNEEHAIRQRRKQGKTRDRRRQTVDEGGRELVDEPWGLVKSLHIGWKVMIVED